MSFPELPFFKMEFQTIKMDHSIEGNIFIWAINDYIKGGNALALPIGSTQLGRVVIPLKKSSSCSSYYYIGTTNITLGEGAVVGLSS